MLGKKLDKQFDAVGTFQSQGDKVGLDIPVIATHLPSVDLGVFGCGGFPRGRIVEIYGENGSGKTAFACHLIGRCQKEDGIAAFVDAEHALDPTFATTQGVNMGELIVSQPDCGEQAFEIIDALIESGTVDLIVVDSVAGMVPRAELSGDYGDSHMGLHARLMSQGMRKLVGMTYKKNVTLVFINQTRSKIGLVFGDPTVTPGGAALKFAASVRLEIRRIANSKGGEIKEGEKIIGHKINIKAKKNKCGMPFRETVVTLHYDTGFSVSDDVIDHAISIGILSGNAWLIMKGSDQKYRREDLTTEANLAMLNSEIRKYYAI